MARFDFLIHSSIILLTFFLPIFLICPIASLKSGYTDISSLPSFISSSSSEFDSSSSGIFNLLNDEFAKLIMEDVDEEDQNSTSPKVDSNSLEYFNILKNELQHLRMDLTKSFVEQHTRRKRELHGGSFSFKVSINQQHHQGSSSGGGFSSKINNAGRHSTTIFKNSTFIFQSNGIFKLEASSSAGGLDGSLKLVKISTWQLRSGDKILNTYEWEDKLFILTTNSDGSLCQLYTFSTHDYATGSKSPISRQQIRNQGFATSAQFFSHGGNEFYLVITVDNSVHSLTSTPIFRWAHTYMDQIHEVQTRGASAVETFTIGSFKYIAIAQTQDSEKNFEVGTLIVRMYQNGEVEKFQLLWSQQPTTLKHVQLLQEHLLIIGQPNESPVYWFGGFDFLQWQTLDNFTGTNLFLDSFQWQGEPIILAGNENEISVYTRSTSTADASQRSSLSYSSSSKLIKSSTPLFTTKFGDKITDAKILQESKTSFSLAISTKSSSSSSSRDQVLLEIKPLTIVKEEIPASQIKETEDTLSKCLITLDSHLKTDESSLSLFESSNHQLLLKNKPITYTGKIITKAQVFINGNDSNLGTVHIKPEFNNVAEEAYEFTPTKLLSLHDKQTLDFNDQITSQLSNVLLKSQEGEISGQLNFQKQLKINNANFGHLEVRILNGIPWSVWENKILRRDSSSKSQIVTGSWNVEKLNVNSVTLHKNSIEKDFLLKKCNDASDTQIISGPIHFNKNIKFNQNLHIEHDANINHVIFSNIAFKHTNPIIHGYKHGNVVTGGEDLEIDKLNHINIADWHASTLKIHDDSGEGQYSTGKLTFTSDLSINQLQVDKLNGHIWNEFINSVLFDIGDQTIQGDLHVKHLKVDHLNTSTINGKSISQLLSTTSNQDITSKIHATNLKLKKNLNDLSHGSSTVNGIHLSDAVSDKEPAIITGPIEFEQSTFKNINAAEGVTINDLDVSEAVKLRKKYIYSTTNGEESINLNGDIQAHNLYAESMNGISFGSFKDSYWSSTTSNSIEHDFDLSSASSVSVEKVFHTGTLNGLDLENDVVTIDKDFEVISNSLQFTRPVIVHADVEMPDGVTLNEYDFSELNKQIIRTTDEGRRINGKKIFSDEIDVENGIFVTTINGISLENDVIYLRSTKHQELKGLTSFEDIHVVRLDSESDIEVSGAVNGYQLGEVEKLTVYEDGESNVIQSDVVFDKILNVEDLHVNELNGIHVNEIISHVITLNEAHENLNLNLILEKGSLLFEDEADVVQINNILLHEYLPKIVNKNNKFIQINGTKEFHSDINISKNLNCQKINEINLKEIEEFGFSKTKDQIVSGKYLVQEAEIGNLVTGKIGGISVSDFVQINKDVKITSPVKFSKNVIVNDDLTIDGLLNGFDIVKLSEDLKTLKGDRSFNTITIDGNLSWKISHEELERISHVLNNAVTTNTEQIFTHKISFLNGFQANRIISEKWINDIDLAFIRDDAIFKNQEAEFKGTITFEHPIEVQTGAVSVSTLDTNIVNGISLRSLERQIVQKNTNQIVKGHKIFENGFSTNKLIISGTIDNINPRDLVTLHDTRTIQEITFENIHINQNFEFNHLKDLDLHAFLNELVLKDQKHSLIGDITFENDLTVHECHVNSINGLQISNLFLSDSINTQQIIGPKIFNHLIIESELVNTTINNVSFDQLFKQIIRRDDEQIITRPVIFVDTIKVSSSTVHIDTTINNHDIEELDNSFAEKLGEIISSSAVAEAITMDSSESLLEELEANLQNIPGWFEYLELAQDLSQLGSRYRVEHSIHNSQLNVFMYGKVDGIKCGLPSSCTGRSTAVLNILPEGTDSKNFVKHDCDGVFEVTSKSGNDFSWIIRNQVTSVNSTCKQQKTQATTVHFITSTDSDTNRFNFKNPSGATDITSLSIGYVSDVKTFTSAGIDYLVISQLFDPKTNSHSTPTLIYKVESTNKLQLIQSIDSNGATRLSLDYINTKWILGIVNTKSGSSSCNGQSTIHYWDEKTSQFVLIRDVDTENPNDIVSITILSDNHQVEENFIGFAESRETDVEGEQIGKVSIYRFEEATLSYSLYQIIDTIHPTKALSALITKQFNYLVLVAEDGLQFYKYLHAEGFRQDLTVPIKGAQDTNGIVWKDRILFPIAGTQSILAKGVFNGKITQ